MNGLMRLLPGKDICNKVALSLSIDYRYKLELV